MKRRRGRLRWRPRSTVFVSFGGCFVFFAVISGMDYVYYGVVVHGISRNFPRTTKGTQLLIASIHLAIGGIAMIWSGAQPAEVESAKRQGRGPDARKGGEE